MALHGLKSLTVGVPDVTETARYYAEFGLTEVAAGRFATAEGGEQFLLKQAPIRRLLAMSVAADDTDDLDRIARQLAALDLPAQRVNGGLVTREPIADIRVTITITARLEQPPTPATNYNRPGRLERVNTRAPAILQDAPVAPRRLGHLAIGSVDRVATQRFFTDGLGFKISDVVPGAAAFLRCSIDHHNVLVQDAPVNFLHHTSWQVSDVDEIGRGATAMLAEHPERHVWGLGRHHVGSNFFWYLKDPAGNFSEYYSDMDCIVDDQLWTAQDFADARSLYSWGPPPPPSFLHPEDLAAHMIGAHAS